MMLRRHISPSLLLLAVLPLAVLPACERKGEIPQEEENALQKVSLGMSLGTAATEKTKASTLYISEIDTEDPHFSGIADMVMVPFANLGTIVSTDMALAAPAAIGDFANLYTQTPKCLFAPSLDAWFPKGTSSILVYGRAPGELDGIVEKHRYGSLIPQGFFTGNSHPLASSLGFVPDVMYSGTEASTSANRIMRAMNSVMLGDPSVTYLYYETGSPAVQHEFKHDLSWNETIGDRALREAYLQITNDGAVIPGSGPLVEALLTNLYRLLLSYESHNTNVYEVEVNGIAYPVHDKDGNDILYKDLYGRLKDVLLNRFRSSSYLDINKSDSSVHLANEADRDYPEDMGLPSGCAVLRWTPTGFVVPLIEGVEGIAPMHRYCYPPGLYYYANTTIKTTKDANISQSYNKGYTTWSQVLGDYTLGTSITSNTTGVALVKQLNYAVGTLVATVKASRERLQDNDGLPETTVEATDENLPVTGLILGRQYAQRFDFTPIFTEDGEYFLYDNQMPGVFLTTSPSAPIRTLSLQTPDDKDVYFTLELRNDTNQTFFGADGRVLPGRKFYMVGKLELPEDVSDRVVNGKTINSVFLKDHCTTVTCTINSLSGAYNAIPDLGKAQLVVGIQTKVNWTLSTPTTLLLE